MAISSSALSKEWSWALPASPTRSACNAQKAHQCCPILESPTVTIPSVLDVLLGRIRNAPGHRFDPGPPHYEGVSKRDPVIEPRHRLRPGEHFRGQVDNMMGPEREVISLEENGHGAWGRGAANMTTQPCPPSLSTNGVSVLARVNSQKGEARVRSPPSSPSMSPHSMTCRDREGRDRDRTAAYSFVPLLRPSCARG